MSWPTRRPFRAPRSGLAALLAAVAIVALGPDPRAEGPGALAPPAPSVLRVAAEAAPGEHASAARPAALPSGREVAAVRSDPRSENQRSGQALADPPGPPVRTPSLEGVAAGAAVTGSSGPPGSAGAPGPSSGFAAVLTPRAAAPPDPGPQPVLVDRPARPIGSATDPLVRPA
jgi:hypothetical protein